MPPRDFKRSERVAGQLRRDLARLIQQEIKDPEVGFVSLSDVEVTRDLSHAKVFITVFEPEKAQESLKALRRAASVSALPSWPRNCVYGMCRNCILYMMIQWSRAVTSTI